ncbi:MAG: hypothetical protein ACREAZ_13275 [Nitrososphaera sp.]
MASRTGLPTIKEFAAFLCTFLSVWIPIVKRTFPDDTELHLALETLRLAACTAVAVVDARLDIGD